MVHHYWTIYKWVYSFRGLVKYQYFKENINFANKKYKEIFVMFSYLVAICFFMICEKKIEKKKIRKILELQHF